MSISRSTSSASSSSVSIDTPIINIPSWSETLKLTLSAGRSGHYPATHAYIHHNSLVASIELGWRAQLRTLILDDIQNEHYGRRKHFWQEMDCLIVYELLEENLTIEDDEFACEKWVRHEMWILCPQFSGRSVCPAPFKTPAPVPESRPMAIRGHIAPKAKYDPHSFVPTLSYRYCRRGSDDSDHGSSSSESDFSDGSSVASSQSSSIFR